VSEKKSSNSSSQADRSGGSGTGPTARHNSDSEEDSEPSASETEARLISTSPSGGGPANPSGRAGQGRVVFSSGSVRGGGGGGGSRGETGERGDSEVLSGVDYSFHYTGKDLESLSTRHSKVFRYAKDGSPYCSVKMLSLSVRNAPPPALARKSCLITNKHKRNEEKPGVQWVDRCYGGRKLVEYPPDESEAWSFHPSPAVLHAEKVALDQVNRLRARETEDSKEENDTSCRQCVECTIA